MTNSLLADIARVIRVFSIVALCASQLTAQDPFAGNPIPNGPDAKTNGEYREGFYCYASTGDVKDLVFDAAQLAKSNTKETLEQAIAKLNTAANKNTDERAEVYLTSRPRLLSELLDFQEGGWAALTFDESLSGWNATSGV